MRVHFNYGAEVTEDDNLILWKPDGDRIALLDGDMIPYIVGFTIKEMSLVRANTRVKSGQFATIEETPECKWACDRVNSVINSWVRQAKCDAARIFMTDSPKNFRINLAFSNQYKGGRNPDKPPFFYEMRAHLLKVHGAIISDGDEADDLMSIEQWKGHHAFLAEAGDGAEVGSLMHREFSNTVIVSADKDLMIVPGWHLTPGKDQELKWVDRMGWLDLRLTSKGAVKDLKGAGLKFFYAQMIIGDNVDNYKGIPGRGAKYAYDLLDNCKDERELFNAVLSAYKSKFGSGTVLLKNYRGGTREGRAIDLMLECGRLAHMATYPGDIWREEKGRMMWGGDGEWL